MPRVRHLNCGDLRPLRLVHAVCHILLLEYDDGLVLVDTGFAVADLTRPGRLGGATRLMGLDPDPERAALRQIERLGFAAADVRDIVLTHLDLDHCGGLVDFPGARVHTTAQEHAAATDPVPRERRRYPAVTLAHGPEFRTYGGPGEQWLLDLTAYPVDGVTGVHLVPMPGHTRGHAAVAVARPDGGVLVHAGDAAFDGSAFGGSDGSGGALGRRAAFRGYERLAGLDPTAVRRNHATLTRLERTPGVELITAHDPRQFALRA